MRPACVLLSGGLDSAVLLRWALRRHRPVHPFYARCGLRWERAELHSLRRLLRAVRRPGLRPLTVADLPVAALYGRHWSLSGKRVPGYRSPDAAVYLPGRNLLLIAAAALFCARRGVPRVLIGTLRANPFADSTPAFRRTLQRACRTALGRPFAVEAPFARLAKRDVLALGRDWPLHLTFSCVAPRGLSPCGRCNKCAERDKVLPPRRPPRRPR
jgi:7-cyano-7-deazaguanine synthase